VNAPPFFISRRAELDQVIVREIDAR
jgi:hypothetical protein